MEKGILIIAWTSGEVKNQSELREKADTCPGRLHPARNQGSPHQVEEPLTERQGGRDPRELGQPLTWPSGRTDSNEEQGGLSCLLI